MSRWSWRLTRVRRRLAPKHRSNLATATRTDAALPDDLVDAAAGFYDDMEEAYREAGYLGEPVPVGSDADAQTRLLARLGRSAQAPVGN